MLCTIKHLMTGPEGNSELCFPRISMFPSTSSRETLRFEGKKFNCFPRDQSSSDLFYSKTKQKQILKMRWDSCDNIRPPSTTCSDHVQRFPFDVIVFAMLPAHGIWRKTVSLLDVMWPWTSQWMARCSGKNAGFRTISNIFLSSSRSLWVGACNSTIFLSRCFHRPIYF